MCVLLESIAFMREAEGLVIGRTFEPKNRVSVELADAFLHVPWFVMAGLKALVYSLSRGIVLTLLWWLVLQILSLGSRGSVEASTSAMIWGAVFLSAGSMLFGLPSGLMASYISNEHVSRLAKNIVARAKSIESIGILRAGVLRIETTGLQRVSTISWVLGFIWGFLLWGASTWVLAPGIPESIRNGVASYELVGILLFAIVLCSFVSYREANRILSHTVAFAFLEAEALTI